MPLIFIFTILCDDSKGFKKAFKDLIKTFQAPQNSVKTKISVNFLSSSTMGTEKVNIERSTVFEWDYYISIHVTVNQVFVRDRLRNSASNIEKI